MKLSPLQLTNYTVEERHCEINPGFLNEEERDKLLDESHSVTLGLGFEVLTSQEQREALALRLRVSVNSDEEDFKARPFKARCSVLGEFKFVDERENRPPTENLEEFFYKSAITILYGLIRHEIASMTSGQVFQKIVLPVADFTSAIEDVVGEEDIFRQLSNPTKADSKEGKN